MAGVGLGILQRDGAFVAAALVLAAMAVGGMAAVAVGGSALLRQLLPR